MSKLELDFGDATASGFLGCTESGFGTGISASISVSGGGQIQTVTAWNESGFQVPIYAYVAAGIPKATLTADRGIDKAPDGCSATFVKVGGDTTTISVTSIIPDPSQAKATGGGSSFTWIVTTPLDPYGSIENGNGEDGEG